MLFKLIWVVVLCFVFDGATVVAGAECDYGVCKPYKSCQSAQLARSLKLNITAARALLYASERVTLMCQCEIHRINPRANTLGCFERAVSRSILNSSWRPSMVQCPKYLKQVTLCRGDPHKLTFCKRGVCCYDNVVSRIPVASDFIYFFNLFNAVAASSETPSINIRSRHPTKPTSTPGYGPYTVGTNPPQWATKSTSTPGYGPYTVGTNPSQWATKPTSTPGYGPYTVGTNPPQWATKPTSTPAYGPYTVGTNPSQWATKPTSTPGYGPYTVGTNPPQWATKPTSTPGYGPYTVGTNPPQWATKPTSTPGYGPYPVGTNPPQWPTTNTSSPGGPNPVHTNRPELPIASTNTSGYGQFPTGTIRPPQSTISTAHQGWPTTNTTTTAKPVATTPRPTPTTTEYVPPVYDYVAKEPVFEGCRELNPKLTTNKIGRPAWDKCVDYQQLVYPCQRSVSLLGNMVRVNNCAHAEPKSREKIARPDEFPHMVVLGARRRSEEPLRWTCVGTLISERFILSSAYCLAARKSNDQIYAVVGFMQRAAGNNEAYQEHKIESTTLYDPRYNGYKKDNRYHDIALVKTATEIRLNQWVIPACLDVFGDNKFRAVATRWRARSWDDSNVLQKVFLHQLNKAEYQNKFPDAKHKVANQMAYGTYGASYDNCRFDNEGSLTVENHLVHCMYTVIGVSSSIVSPTCGPLPSGIYTGVANYTSWIEQIVWPDENTVLWGS